MGSIVIVLDLDTSLTWSRCANDKMKHCAVYGCLGGKLGKSKSYRFPKEENLRLAWVERCARPNKFNVSWARVCDRHFSAVQLKPYRLNLFLPPTNFRNLKEDAIPDINLKFYDKNVNLIQVNYYVCTVMFVPTCN